MAAIVNYRDVLLQAASPRVLPVPIPEVIKEQLRRLKITASATAVTEDGATTTPASITLTAVKEGTLTGAVTWAATGATVVGSGDTVSVAGTSIADAGATVTASVTQDGKTYTAQINLTKVKVPKGLRIETSATTFIGHGSPTNPSTITLTAVRSGGLTGTVTWSVFAGSATITPSGDTCTVTGSSVAGYSVTIKATVGTYSATIALTRLGELSAQEKVDLTSMVTGQLANGNVSGLGALALLNAVNLNTQTVGALNGATQVTNLGTLAYANAIAANQIGAGTLAAGVVYAGTINADQVNAGSFSGKTFTGGQFSGGSYTSTLGTYTANLSSGGIAFFENGNLRASISPGGAQFNSVSLGASYGVTISGGQQAGLYLSGPPAGAAMYMVGRLRWNDVYCNFPTGTATKYLRDDGQWVTPSTSGGVTSFNSRTGAVSLTASDVSNASAGSTLSVNVTGTAGDTPNLGGYTASSYMRGTGGLDPSSRTPVGYLPVSLAGANAYIQIFV